MELCFLQVWAIHQTIKKRKGGNSKESQSEFRSETQSRAYLFSLRETKRNKKRTRGEGMKKTPSHLSLRLLSHGNSIFYPKKCFMFESDFEFKNSDYFCKSNKLYSWR